MKITVFQALTILADKYGQDETQREKLAQIHYLYLMGIRTDKDLQTLEELLKDKHLRGYQVDKSKEAINQDPVRRYFESHLCNETLKYSLDNLDKKSLTKHFNRVFKKIPFKIRILIPPTIYHGSVHGIAAKKSDTAPEYISALKKLREKDSFKSLDPNVGKEKKVKKKAGKKKFKERKAKMTLLAKTAHAAMTAVSLRNDNFPLNLYKQEGSVYQANIRGRVDRKDEAGNKQTVMPNSLGIMRSYMPLPSSDELYSEKKSEYVRPTDRATYLEGAKMPEASFGTLVTPFVNSISGTMLCQLRVISELEKKGRFELAKDPQQLKDFFRSFVSYMLLNSGGHSIHEFLEVLQLPEIKEELKTIPGFEKIDMRLLFQEENQKAFQDAMKKTIEYNNSILQRNNVLDEINQRRSDFERTGTGITGLKPVGAPLEKPLIDEGQTEFLKPPKGMKRLKIKAKEISQATKEVVLGNKIQRRQGIKRLKTTTEELSQQTKEIIFSKINKFPPVHKLHKEKPDVSESTKGPKMKK